MLSLTSRGRCACFDIGLGIHIDGKSSPVSSIAEKNSKISVFYSLFEVVIRFLMRMRYGWDDLFVTSTENLYHAAPLDLFRLRI